MLISKGMYLLLGVIGNVAVEPRKNTSDDPIRKLDEDSMLVSLSKLSFKDQPNHSMVELS